MVTIFTSTSLKVLDEKGFDVKELLVTSQAGVLMANFDEIEAYLNNQLADYKKLVFTEDNKKDAKDTVASLRKDKKALADKMIAVKKEYMQPWEMFSGKANDVIALYDEPINYINEQLEAFELKRKQEKQQVIKALYEEMVPEAEWQEIIPLEKIYNHRWENATAKDKQIKEEIMDYKLKAKSALETIKGFNSDMEQRAISMYKQSFDIAEVVTFLNNYEQSKRDILAAEQEKTRQQEMERIREEERAKIAAEQQQAAEVEAAKAEVIDTFIPDDAGEAKKYTYMITLTEDGKRKLEMFMDSVGIEYDELVF